MQVYEPLKLSAVVLCNNSPTQKSPSRRVSARPLLLLGTLVILMFQATVAPAQGLIERERNDDEWRKSRLQREPGTVYLEDFYPGEPIHLAVKPDAHAYYKPDMQRYLGTLHPGQMVELIAIAPNSYRVRGNAQQGQIAGWTSPEVLEALDAEFVETLFKAAKRHEEVQALIEENAIALGMSAEEVIKSLGDPERKTSRIGLEGREDIWDFITYKTVPERVTGYDRFGRLVSEIAYVKKPVGRLTAVFEEGILTSVEQTEGDLEGEIKIVSRPLYLVR